MMPVQGRSLTLVEVIRFCIVTLTRWAADKTWGELRIVVQNGQIQFVHEDRSYRDRLPVTHVGDVEPVMRQLVAVK